MLIQRYAEWDNLRARLNHDWLPKKYINFLSAWAESLDDIINDNAIVSEEVLAQFETWNEVRSEFALLISSAEIALSPRQLIDDYPLNSMKENDKEWLREIIHTLYCERTKIKAQIVALQKSFKDISTQHVLLMKVLQGKYMEVASQLDTNPFAGFRDQMIQFCKLISSLPHGIQFK